MFQVASVKAMGASFPVRNLTIGCLRARAKGRRSAGLQRPPGPGMMEARLRRSLRMRPALILIALLAALPAAARPLKPAEGKALDAALSAYLAALGAGDAEGIVGAMPPRVLKVFAAATGMEEAALKATLVQQTGALMGGTKVRDLAADQSALDAGDETLADGTKVTWALIPTAFVSEAGGKAVLNSQPLLALSEDKAWHFLRIDGPERRQVAALAYPFLAGKDFPEATTKPAP